MGEQSQLVAGIALPMTFDPGREFVEFVPAKAARVSQRAHRARYDATPVLVLEHEPGLPRPRRWRAAGLISAQAIARTLHGRGRRVTITPDNHPATEQPTEGQTARDHR